MQYLDIEHILTLRLRLFWRKTISGNHFTPHCVFGCAWKIEFFGKTISFDREYYGFDPEIVLHFYFHFKPFPDSDAQRERERERERESEMRE